MKRNRGVAFVVFNSSEHVKETLSGFKELAA